MMKPWGVCVFSSLPFWTSSSLDVPAGVTQEEGHTGFLMGRIAYYIIYIPYVKHRSYRFHMSCIYSGQTKSSSLDKAGSAIVLVYFPENLIEDKYVCFEKI